MSAAIAWATIARPMQSTQLQLAWPTATADVSARLVIVHPRAQVGTHALAELPVVIGRKLGPGVDIAAGHPTVSRAHATLAWDPLAGHHTVLDRGSRHGTRLHGQPVQQQPRPLAHEAVLRFGDVVAVYERGEAEASRAGVRRSEVLAVIDLLHARGRPDAPTLEFVGEAVEALLLPAWADDHQGLQRLVHACGAAMRTTPLTRATISPWLRDELSSGTDAPAPRRPRPSRDELVATLTSHGWSIRATAKHYERDRKQISRWLEMYALTAPGRADG